MRFAVVVLACLVACASAQFNRYQNNQYNPFNKDYNRYNQNSGQYNGQYNYNNRYNYNAYKPTYRPYVSSTPFPRPAVTVTPAPVVVPKATPAPVVFAPAPAPVAPVVPAPVVPVPVVSAVRASVDARNAETLKYGNEINPDGTYNYFFETNSGIAAQAQGTPRNFGGNPPVVPDVAQGSFSWVSPEGQVVAITYVADENGYQPQGDALPVGPEIPAQIARALAYTAKYHQGSN